MSKTLKKPLITSAFPVNDYVATDKMLGISVVSWIISNNKRRKTCI